MLFFPIQQELDCISDDGRILGRIRFDGSLDQHVFQKSEEVAELTVEEQSSISKRLELLDSEEKSIPMQDDD